MATIRPNGPEKQPKAPIKNNAKKALTPSGKAPVKPKPITPSKASLAAAKAATDLRDINKYLTGDTTYQGQVAASNRALGDYLAQAESQRGMYDTQYAQNVNTLNRQSEIDQRDLANDFAARGMYRSGGYGVAEAERATGIADQISNLDISRGSYRQQLDAGIANFRTQQQLTQQQARNDAISRRAIALLQGS